jgi:hypothetical protein
MPTTGLDSFADPAGIGPLYPFPGLEWLFVVVTILLWLFWHVRNMQDEDREYREAREHYKRLRLQRVMFRGGTALIPSEAELVEEHPPIAEDPPLQAKP